MEFHTKTLEMLSNAFVDNAILRTTVLQWHRCFKAGMNSTEDDAPIGRPKTSVSGDNVDIINEMVMSNHRITVEELAEEISIYRMGLVMLFYANIGRSYR